MPSSFFKIKPDQKKRVGLHISPEGIALAFANTAMQSHELLECEWIAEPEPLKQKALLLNLVSRLKLKKMACYVVLDEFDYQIYRTETPNVPSNEMKDALFWQANRLASTEQGEKVFEYFYSSDKSIQSKNSDAYIISTNKSKIKYISSMIYKSGLTLKSIDIEEFSIRNILKTKNEKEESISVVCIDEKKIRVFIIKNNDILFYRKIEMAIMDIGDAKDLILLEMQRSFDYYERQTFGEEIKKIFFCSKIESVNENFFSDSLLDIPIEHLINSSRIFDYKKEYHFNLIKKNLVSLGALLKGI